jgi:uncharacterized membrane protein
MRRESHLSIDISTYMAAGILLIISSISIAADYQVTLIGNGYVYAYGINNNNHVCGFVNPNDSWSNPYAFFWSPSSGMRSLGGYIAYNINESDQIAGRSSMFQAAVWENGSCINLSGRQEAESINDKGQVTGLISSQLPGKYYPYRCDDIHTSSFVTLGLQGHGFGINNKGEIVGDCGGGSSGKINYGVFYYSNSQYKILNDFGNYDTHAWRLNDIDQIVGYSRVNKSSVINAVFWNSPDSVMEYMGTLGTGNSLAYAINSSGQAVGTSSGFAFLWNKQEGMRNLNDLIDPSLGIALTYARDISDNGSIIAWGVDSMGNKGSYLLTPEPATLLLLGLGAVIAARRR